MEHSGQKLWKLLAQFLQQPRLFSHNNRRKKVHRCINLILDSIGQRKIVISAVDAGIIRLRAYKVDSAMLHVQNVLTVISVLLL